MKIEKVNNGYILELDNGITYIANDTKELFTRMLFLLENKSEIGYGSKYGKVIIEYDKSEEEDEDGPLK
jgi:hypothetical protein